MSRVKFKIWDKTRNKWLTSNCGQFLLNQNGDLVFHQEGLNPLEEVKSAIDYEIVRDTGLKDKCGKAIYEGNILQFYNDVDYIIKPGYAKVVFKDGAFCCKHFKYGTEYLANMDMSDMDITVVGNIYENPELLEGDSK
ncbi:YopX family protein [Clostridium paraputrificum]|uniref:YopX family protein n=1 Tax=Clostridium paraputrificum TaxID=29363 RepID=UPI0006875AEF|nr:YopX family protein [Clostridium paraputrificum]